MKRVNIHLDERHLDFLIEVKTELGTPWAETIRRLLDESMQARERDKNKSESDTNPDP